jgi:Mor family transcriptional regulator
MAEFGAKTGQQRDELPSEYDGGGFGLESPQGGRMEDPMNPDGIADYGVAADRSRWPKDFSLLVDVIRAELDKPPLDRTNPSLAVDIAFAIAKWGGGRSFYLPNGKRIEAALLHERIFCDWSRFSPRELSERYRLSEQHIYSVLRNMLKIHREKTEPELPL